LFDLHINLTSQSPLIIIIIIIIIIINIVVVVVIVIVIVILLLLLFVIYIVHLLVVRSRSCQVIYYFDTPALGRRRQSFYRVSGHNICVLIYYGFHHFL